MNILYRLLVVFTLIGSVHINICAQELMNRYSHPLVRIDNRYHLTDEAKIRTLNVFDLDNAPADMFMPYQSKRIFTSDADYQQCETKRFLYKRYPIYDLYLEVDVPKGEGVFPFMMWIHGGGWEAGDFDGMKNMSTYLASHGIAGVRISYSLLPQGGDMHKAWEDIKDALAFVGQHAEELKIDVNSFGFGGHSAGAHLSAYAAMRTSGTKLLVAFNGAYDLEKIKKGYEPNDHHFQFLGKTAEERRDASPVNFVHTGAPYCLLGYSSGDCLVDPDQIEMLSSKLDEYNVPHHLLKADLYSHSAFLATDLYEPTLMKVLIAAKEHLK